MLLFSFECGTRLLQLVLVRVFACTRAHEQLQSFLCERMCTLQLVPFELVLLRSHVLFPRPFPMGAGGLGPALMSTQEAAVTLSSEMGV